MKKILLIFPLLFILFSGCKTSKKIISQEKNSIDSTKQNSTLATTEDSFAIATQTLSAVSSTFPAYTFFYAKVKLDYESANENLQATVYIRIQKDSIIWISVTGPLGIEGARALIRPDSLQVMNKIDKTILTRPVNYLQEKFHIPIDFYALQDLITGNALFNDSNIAHYLIRENVLQLILPDTRFQNKVLINTSTNNIDQNILYDADSSSSRNAAFTYSSYEKNSGYTFSTERKILVHDKNDINIELSFKQYSFNEPQTFPFNIPKNYSIK